LAPTRSRARGWHIRNISIWAFIHNHGNALAWTRGFANIPFILCVVVIYEPVALVLFLFVFTMLFVIGHVFFGWLTTILPLVIVVALGIFSFELGTLVILFVVFAILFVIGHVFITWLALHLPLVFIVALGIFSFELGTLVVLFVLTMRHVVVHMLWGWITRSLSNVLIVTLRICVFELGTHHVRVGFTARDGFFTSAPF